MRSRREVLKITFGLTAGQWLCGQDADKVVVNVAVTDRNGRYINGLKPSDFRIFEDDIPQQITTFANDEVASAYTITYVADPSNQNQGFRRLRVEIITDTDKQWRVRHRPGYRPKARD